MEKSTDEGLDFKSQFYNLQGIHINERKKNFYKLLKSTSPDQPADQIDIEPRNYQENIFYVDVLIHFRKVEKLIEILKGGNGELTSKILKEQWFFQEAFNNKSEEYIVNKFLPTLSYPLRMKVLKKLSLTLGEDRMDKIFDLVLERYGLFIAKQFLFSCSPEKIIHSLRSNEIILTSEQLKRLLQKDINLVKIYFEEYRKNRREDFHDNDFLRYLVWKHPNLYFELGLNTKSSIKVGHCTSRAVIKTNKDEVLKDVQNCFLSKAVLVRDVKQFDKEYLFLFFPDDMKGINSFSLEELVSKYPIKRRWDVLSQAFKQAYNKEIVDHLDSFEINLANIFPEKIRQRWAEIKYSDGNRLKYIKYYDPKKAFTLLKEKINVTPGAQLRARLLKELISVCCEYKDYTTYEEVLKYICTRHRGETKSLRTAILSHITENTDFNVLTEVHWKYINEIIDTQRVKGEPLSFRLIPKYLLFVYKKNLPLEGPVMQFAKDCINGSRSFRLEELKESEAESAVLKRIVQILPTIKQKHSRDVIFQIMYNVANFNRDIKTDKLLNKDFKRLWIDISECQFIIDVIKEICTKQEPYKSNEYGHIILSSFLLYNQLYSDKPLKVIDDDALLKIVKTMLDDNDTNWLFIENMLPVIKKNERNEFENKVLDFFFDGNRLYFDHLKQNVIKHFFATEPEVVAKYFSEILSFEVRDRESLFDYGFIKRYGHLGLEDKVITYFKSFVSIDSKCDRKSKLFTGLSKLMNTAEFIDLVKDYTPTAQKLDLDNPEQKEVYQVQCDIAKAFKNLDEPSTVVPVLMHYCQGDYLQSSLTALFKVLYRIDEEQARSSLNILGGRAMSTRKQAVFLGFNLLSVKDATTIYSMLSNKETNISAKKYLFDAVLKYFIRNPLESLLDIVFRNTDFVDKNDAEMIQKFVESCSKVPNKYKSLFVEKVWTFLDVLERQKVDVVGYRNTLLDTISNYEIGFILKLSKDFCVNVIKTYFLSSDDSLLKTADAIDYFVINYLLAYLDDTHFELVFSIIKTYKDVHWKQNNKDTITYIFRFFSNAYGKCDENDVTYLKLFTSFWQGLFSHEESFSEYTLLKLMALYKENSNIESFCKEVDKCFQELASQFGPHIIQVLIKCFKGFYHNIHPSTTDFSLENFALHLLEANSSELNCLIMFNIIQGFISPDQKKIHSKLVDALKSATNFTGRVYCNILLKTFAAGGDISFASGADFRWSCTGRKLVIN